MSCSGSETDSATEEISDDNTIKKLGKRLKPNHTENNKECDSEIDKSMIEQRSHVNTEGKITMVDNENKLVKEIDKQEKTNQGTKSTWNDIMETEEKQTHPQKNDEQGTKKEKIQKKEIRQHPYRGPSNEGNRLGFPLHK